MLAIELGTAAQDAGLCSLPGSSPNVGVTGYTLGGGLSWLGRRYGFACNRVEAIEVVTADGEQRRVDAETEPDLFWALRGGGGELRDRHRPAPPPAADRRGIRGRAGVPGRGRRRGGARPTATGRRPRPTRSPRVVRFLRPPPLPDVPEPLRDRPLLTIDGACIGDRGRGRRADRAAARDRRADHGHLRADARRRGWAASTWTPSRRSPASAMAVLVRELPDEAIDAFVEPVGPRGGLAVAARRAAPARRRAGTAGRGRRRALAPRRRLRDVRGRHADDSGAGRGDRRSTSTRSRRRMQPWAGEGDYFNFAERPCDVEAIFARRAATASRR